MLWSSVVVEALGSERGLLRALRVKDLKTGAERDVEVSGLFFAIGHEPASAFLGGQARRRALLYRAHPGNPVAILNMVLVGRRWRAEALSPPVLAQVSWLPCSTCCLCAAQRVHDCSHASPARLGEGAAAALSDS
jgi:hypothetical protein